MRKVKSNALWRRLSDQQQETLDHWLFDDELSYAVILPRAQKELGFKGQMSSLKRYFSRRDKERTVKRFDKLRLEVLKVQGAPVNEKELRVASMRLLCEFLFQQSRQCPEKVKEWGMIASLIVDNDRNELLREVKGEELKMRQKTLDFAKEKFQTDMVEQALQALPDLQELAQARRAAVPNAYVENAHLNRARRKMFGVVWEVRPESPEEEAAMLAAKREREAAAAPESEERITEPQPPPPGSPYYHEYLEWKAKREAEWREGEKACHQSHAQAAEADQAKQEKSRKQQEARARFEELRELCGWQEVEWPPGWEEK